MNPVHFSKTPPLGDLLSHKCSMSTISLLFWLIQDPFDDLLIGATKFAHAFSDTGTTEIRKKLLFTFFISFLKTYHPTFEVHSVNLEILIHPLKSCIHVLHYLDHEDPA